MVSFRPLDFFKEYFFGGIYFEFSQLFLIIAAMEWVDGIWM